MITVEQGSSLYYCLLWTDTDARERFIRRLNLVQALSTTLNDVQEHQVAEKKIHWWHEELQRMCEGSARHPSTKACQDDAALLTKQYPDLAENPFMTGCLSLLSSTSTTRFTPPQTISERQSQLVENFQSRLALLSHALSESVEDLEVATHPEQAAEALGKHDQLSRLPSLIHRGHPVFSDETYKSHNVNPNDLAAGIRVASNPENLSHNTGNTLVGIPIIEEKAGKKSLLTEAIADTHATFADATTRTTVSSRYRREPLLPIWRLLVLRRKQLALWEKNRPDLLVEHMALTPIAKLFHAWRNRR